MNFRRSAVNRVKARTGWENLCSILHPQVLFFRDGFDELAVLPSSAISGAMPAATVIVRPAEIECQQANRPVSCISPQFPGRSVHAFPKSGICHIRDIVHDLEKLPLNP
jgi:hypothetical protein